MSNISSYSDEVKSSLDGLQQVMSSFALVTDSQGKNDELGVKLEGESNYDLWNFSLTTLLMAKELIGVIDGTIPKPENSHGNAVNAWVKKDNNAKYIIVRNVKNKNLLLSIMNCKTSKEMFDVFKNRFDSDDKIQSRSWFHEFCCLHQRNFECLSDFFTRLEYVCLKLESVNWGLCEGLKVAKVLFSLNEEYNETKNRLLALDDGRFKLSLVRQQLEMVEKSIRAYNKDDSGIVLNVEKKEQNAQSNKRSCFNCNKMHTGGWRKCKLKLKKDLWNKLSNKEKDERRKKYPSLSSSHMATTYMATKELIQNKKHNLKMEFVMDSGCTDMMVNDDRKIIEKTYLEADSVKTANGGCMKVESIGTLNTKMVKLQKVLYVPDLDRNLMSVSKIVDKNDKVLFEKDKVRVIRGDVQIKGNVIMAGGREGDLFKVTLDNEHISANSAEICEDDKRSDIEIWHRRLGHLGEASLKDLVKNHKVYGLTRKILKQSLSPCKHCSMGKKRSSKFNKVTMNGGSEIKYSSGESYSFDTCGPLNVESMGRKRYFSGLIDEEDGFSWVKFSYGKKDCHKQVMDQLIANEVQFGVKAKRFKDDSGTEIVKGEFLNFLSNRGIEHVSTHKARSQENGKAERFNLRILNDTRTFLSESGLPKKFWSYAVKYSNEIRNRTSYAKDKEKLTPYEIKFWSLTVFDLKLHSCVKALTSCPESLLWANTLYEGVGRREDGLSILRLQILYFI